MSLAELLSEKRESIMRNIRGDVDREAENFGIQIVDVRIGRTDLPDETSQAVYNRMKSEREKEALKFRAEGREAATKIKATPDGASASDTFRVTVGSVV